MYAVPLGLLVLLAIVAFVWSPLFAVVVAALLFVAFLAYAGLRPGAERKTKPPAGSAAKYEDDKPKGAWGGPRP